MALFQNSLANLLRAVGPDVLCLIVIVIFAAIGWYKGFIKSAIQLVGGFLVLALAFFVSAPIAEKAFDAMFYKTIHESVSKYVISEDVEEVKNQIQGAMNELPDWVNKALKTSGVTSSEDIYNAISDKVDGTTTSVVNAVVDKVMRPILTAVIRWVCFLIITFIGFLLVPILANVLGKIIVIPGVDHLNKSLGVVLGIIQGVVVVFIIVTLIAVLEKTDVLKTEWIADSRIIRLIDGINPSSNMIEKTIKDIFKK